MTYPPDLPDKVKCQSVEEEYLGQYDDLPIKIGFPEKVDKECIAGLSLKNGVLILSAILS